jgi:hypothetical protein
MSRRTDLSVVRGDRRIGSWRIVGGALVHFVVPVYLVVVPVACLLAAPAGATVGEMARNAPAFSGWFLGAYSALTVVATLTAAVLDRLGGWRGRRRALRDPGFAALESERRVRRALADARRGLDGSTLPLLDALRGPRWDHGDPRCQTLSADLERVVDTSLAAFATAPPERRADLLDVTKASLARIEAALSELYAERSALDEGDARTVARYVESRYSGSDFAGDGT